MTGMILIYDESSSEGFEFWFRLRVQIEKIKAMPEAQCAALMAGVQLLLDCSATKLAAPETGELQCP